MAPFLPGTSAGELPLDAPHLSPGDVDVVALQHGHHLQPGRGRQVVEFDRQVGSVRFARFLG